MANQELNVPTKQETREEVTRAGRTYVPQVDIYETLFTSENARKIAEP